jgi:C4-dicarboxylate-specific signal transduction histidine kinase
MNDLPDAAAPVTTDRAFSTADLAYINRMTTTGLVLPSVAHEINNSLQVIAGMVEILGLRGQLAPDVADKVQKIATQATKAAGTLRDLVAFSRRDGVAPRVDVRSAAERAVALRRYYLSRGKVAVTIDAAPGEAFVALADSQHVIQILVNLIINAEEAIAAEEAKEVTLRVARSDDRITCVVTDSGPGLPPPIAAQVGAPFLTTKDAGAAGLGLAVARRLMTGGGGTLEVTAGPPTSVTLSWPAA